MKEHKLPINSFIQGYYIPTKVCDELVKNFNKLKRFATLGTVGPEVLDPKRKKSLDLHISSTDSSLFEYNELLTKACKMYEKTYDFHDLGFGGYTNTVEGSNIQYYKPGEGFYKYHAERLNITRTRRCLVYMTYLNDVPDGGTEFKFQKLKVPAVKGLTLIWPSDFTHTHRGIISKTKEKYIITGWMNYVS
tara:strand:+ start:826 stop:1398 length:573 start_codon:yes stop_codon:yes gene_type:complete